MHIPLASGAWLDHEPAWLSPEEAHDVFTALSGEMAWEQREIVLFGRRILQPRLIAWAGELPYRYSGQTLEPRAFTPTLQTLLVRVRERSRAPFNHVLANRYRSGDDSMGLHADDEPELGRDPVVAIVSLGVTRRLMIRPRQKQRRERYDQDLGHGALLIMGGSCQRHYVHGIPRQPALTDERISLTFRHLLRSP